MLDESSIKSRLHDLQYDFTGDIQQDTILRGQIDTLHWILNNGDLKTPQQIETKIQRIKEEMIPLMINDLPYQEKSARIKELRNCIEENYHIL